MTRPPALVPHVALLRGVNVGRGNRIAMADLRAMVASLGYTEVRTLLNSGNVLFTAPVKDNERARAGIEAALARPGLQVRVVVRPVSVIRRILDANPLAAFAVDPARFLVALFTEGAPPAPVAALAQADWGDDRFAIAGEAAYLCCASGILDGALAKAFNRAARDGATTRNLATMQKLAG